MTYKFLSQLFMWSSVLLETHKVCEIFMAKNVEDVQPIFRQKYLEIVVAI